MSSSAYRIDDLTGDFADSFFNQDFHADCNVATTFKSKSSEGGALKFTWKVNPGCCKKDAELKTSVEAQVDFKTHGTTNSSYFKFKPGKITGHFDLGTQAIKSHTFNPYVVVNIPTTYSDLKKQTKTTLGAVAKFDCKTVPCVLNLNVDLADGGVNIKENWTLQKNNWTFGFLSKFGIGTENSHKTDFIASHRCSVAQGLLRVNGLGKGGIAGWNLGFMWHFNKKWSLGAALNSGKGGCPVTGTQQVGIDWHPCSHIGARLTYDRTTLGFLTNIGKVVHPYLSASLCLESDIHGRTKEGAPCPHRFGAKLTFKH